VALGRAFYSILASAAAAAFDATKPHTQRQMDVSHRILCPTECIGLPLLRLINLPHDALQRGESTCRRRCRLSSSGNSES
jgi:hypothetical protein